MSRVTITGDTTAAYGAGVSGTTLLCGGVGEQDTWESGKGDGAKRGALLINTRSANIGVEESEREDGVLMRNSILVTECWVDYRETRAENWWENLSI